MPKFILNPFTGRPDAAGSGGAGPTPPDVATSYVSDTGTAIPALNILNVLSGTGIETTGSGNTLIVKLRNSGRVTTQTIGAVTSQVVVITLGATPSIGMFVSRVVGYPTDGSNTGIAYFIRAAVKTDGATATIVGSQAKDPFEDASLVTADANVSVLGNSLTITVLGVAGLTINWTIETTFTRS